MKKLFLTIALAIASIAAQAATLAHNFTDDAGVNFSAKNAFSVEKVTGQVKVVAPNGTAYTYADASGALYTKLLNYMATTGSYFQIGGTLLHMNVTETTQITCSGTTSTFGYPSGNYSKSFIDNCAAKNGVVAQSN